MPARSRRNERGVSRARTTSSLTADATLRLWRFPTRLSCCWSVRPGSGKSTWAASRYREVEVVSSDALRAVVGSGTADLDASDDAFRLLDQIVEGRCRRGLTVVVDTLGSRRRPAVSVGGDGAPAGLATVAVVLDTPAAVCRARNATRDRPVPAGLLRLSCAGCARSPRTSSARAGTSGSSRTTTGSAPETTPAPAPARARPGPDLA